MLFRSVVATIAVLALGASSARAQDILASFNRWSFDVNRAIERNVIRPTATAYEKYLPPEVKSGVTRVYDNIIEPATAAGYAIEGEFRAAAASTARFAVNSTIGVLGVLDIAEKVGLPRRYRSFTQSVCNAGLPLGQYLVLPAVGPTTTGVALTAALLMIGPTVALATLSMEQAFANAALDLVEIGASMQTAVAGELAAAPTPEAERDEFLAALPDRCRSQIQ